MSSFPAGKYARYKRATAFFLDWLLRARGGGRHAGQRVQLEALNDVVKEIAADPSTLTPKLLQQLPKALAACQYAITLREHVASFFPEDDEGQVGHQYFLELLQGWHRTLRGVEVETPPELADLQLENSKLENYYEVLQVDEDYSPDESSFVPEKDAPKTAKVDRERLFEEAFADELRMELVYLFMELDELLEGVYKVYSEVKQEKRSLVEATVVVKLAMDTASALTARLQLRYPSLRSAQDMFNIIRNSQLKTFRKKIVDLHSNIMKELQKSIKNIGEPGNYLAKYVPGTFLIELLSVGTTLDGVLSATPMDITKTMFFQDGAFGETYGEDRTPTYVLLPETNKNKVFLLQQLPLLYNAIVEKRLLTGSGFDSLAPMGTFMALIDKFYTTREVSIPVVFACICWMKSVAALQGRRYLSRNVSLTFLHSKELLKNMEAAVASNKAVLAFNKANSLLNRCATDIKQWSSAHHLARANPVIAGLTMLNHHFQYLHIANEVMFATSRFRAFGHLYNALVQEGYLERIPFFDEVYEVYAQEVFTPSRAAAIHGAYYRTYLLSSNVRATSLDAVYRGEKLLPGSEAYKKWKAFHLSDVSEVFRLMRLNDKSILKGGSWMEMLDDVADICSKELFDTRVLSRDLLKLNEDLMDAFSELTQVLGQQEYFQEIMGRPIAGESGQQRVNRALEDSVMTFVMPLLDALQPDESIDMSAIPEGKPRMPALNAGSVHIVCGEVGAMIKARFATDVCEKKYFTFPLQPDFATQEYGKLLLEEKTESEAGAAKLVLDDLMKLLSESDGPLTDSDMSYLKAEIKKNPDLLGTFTPTSEYNDLCTLLHQAAAGPAHDADLVDWMIQMAALIVQPQHCRNEPQQKDLSCPRSVLPNTMAVHSAVIAGYKDIVRVLLEADNLIDLNTKTFHTKESLAHLAVRHGQREVLGLLQAFRIDLSCTDGEGRRVCDVTLDREWSREIAASMKSYYKNTLADVKKLRSQQAEHRRNTQRIEKNKRGSKHSSTNLNGSKRKSNKKEKKETVKEESIIATAAVSSSTKSAEAARIYLRILDAAGVEVDETFESRRLTDLERMLRSKATSLFDQLKDSSVPAGDKVDTVESTCKLIKELQWLVSKHADPSNSTFRHIRSVIATEASIGVHLMQKFCRADHPAMWVEELDPVRDLCVMTSDFAKFVVSTAQICVSVNRKPQAREILDLLEKRLVKTPPGQRDPPLFRELVQTYAKARDAMGLGRTSSADTLRNLEWYFSDEAESYELQMILDELSATEKSS
ncbi:hypothetical protein PInf_023600 [Phytophthora infestans]|nr:hypothetical protein PInf_023600 [Phytophthora infestans]